MVGVVEIAAGVLVAVRPQHRRVRRRRLAGRHHRQPAAHPRLLRRRAARLRPAGRRARPGPAGGRLPGELRPPGRAPADGVTRRPTTAPAAGRRPALRVLHEPRPRRPRGRRARPRPSSRRSGCRWTGTACATPRPDGPRLRRAVRAAPVRPDDVPQRRGVRRAGARPRHPGAVGLRAPPAAVRRGRARRLPARRAHPRPVEAGPGGRDVRPPAAGAGAADQAGRRLAADEPRARAASAWSSRPSTCA